ncbi:MAG: hypothetical protein CBC29_05650 [Methylococcaceae bacterium TMED69]|nr:MAG: hypothetical protein CBC29_05650 [Methylococcaceae bacterium TMED69]|tara:strand:- start:1788 stop:3803 length:2016 start_codon:yes stop_codon:yes gene_type:complete
MADEGLFRRLTKLFRSGPTIKRKVRNYTKSERNASSAVELFKKHHSDVYNSTLSAYGTFDRMARYSDFSEMESTPEIASALDIYAEECVSPDVEGRSLHITSDNRKIRELLETLFYDTLNINFNLVMWVRNLVKYGDFFLFNDVHPDFGVINAYPIPITEMEREEGYDADDPSAVRFRWITQGNQVLENWQVTHFRLLGNDAFLPYGSSVLESARRIWRQLILIEDAMLVYRVIRSPERRVFYIDVGNVAPEDVANYLEQAKTSLKKNMVVQKSTGNVDLRYNPLSVDEDYFIPVRGGDSGTRIENLAGGQNTSAIEDVEYVQKKLFAALKIPKAYLGYDEDIGAKATLAQEDIRFSRTIQRIQKTIVSELNKIAMIHLFSHGFEGEDLLDFGLQLSNPSSLAQQQKLELIRTKFEIAGGAPEGMVSRNWIYKNIFGFSRDEILRLQREKVEDKLNDAELESAGAEEEGGEEGGGDEGGGLFASDLPSNTNILDGNPITAQEGDGLQEMDDDSLDDELDEIDLERIKGELEDIQPASGTGRTVWGTPLKKKRDRKVRNGPGSTHMPDLKKMVLTGKQGRSQDTLSKPYDEDFLNNPFGNTFLESKEKSLANYILGLEEPESEYLGYRPAMSFELQKTLENMSSKLGLKKIINENYDLDEEFDLDLEDEDND